jgi:mutator protein MutT
MPTEIAIAVVAHHGRYLIGARDATSPLAGYDEFPGGKIYSGESPAHAAERECLEETNIAVTAQFLIVPVIEHQYAHGDVRLHFFQCQPIDGTHEPRVPFRWVDRSELPTLRFPEANRTLIETLERQP